MILLVDKLLVARSFGTGTGLRISPTDDGSDVDFDISGRHLLKANNLFFDSHVGTLKSGTFLNYPTTLGIRMYPNSSIGY